MAGQVHVFNKHFEERNINWTVRRREHPPRVGGEHRRPRRSSKRWKTQVAEADERSCRATEAERKVAVEARVDKFWAARASEGMKNSLPRAGHPRADRYRRYAAPKLERPLHETVDSNSLEALRCSSPDVLEQTRQAARAGEPKPALAAPGFRLDLQELRERARKVSALLATSAASRVVERLRERPEIGRWVEAGLAFHDHAPTTCEFCASPLSEARLGDLQAHFSAAFNELKRELEAARTATAQARGARPAIPLG
jgi:wobble nucleotide-excising tRNase